MQSKQDFEAHVDTTFSVPLEEGSLELTLIEVSSVKADTTEAGQAEPFSILFRAAGTEQLEQGTYSMQHEEMGDLVLFIVPIGPDDNGMRYEAVFT